MGQASFTLDLNRCTGCSACRIACESANQVATGLHWRSVATFNEPRWAGTTVLHYSLACNHCRAPACLDGCPAHAYFKDGATGAVLLRGERCMGCRYCAWVCPYGAPQLNDATGVMEKCTFCQPRLEHGELPACVTACPMVALGLTREEEEDQPFAESFPGFPDSGTRPALRLIARRHGVAPPEMTLHHEGVPAAGSERVAFLPQLAAEWPLWAFTSIATVLVAWFAVALLGGDRPPALLFLALGAVGMAASAFHLGRPLRAWRSLANLRSSWISREIACFSVFYVLAGATLSLQPASAAAGWPAACCGLGALVCMDMVYRVRGQEVPAVPHSAMATLTAAFLLALLLRQPVPALVLAGLKVALYCRRKLAGTGVQLRLLSLVRLAGVVLFAPLMLVTSSQPLWPFLLAGVLIGELADRAEFYTELTFLNPRRQAARDLAALVGCRPRTSTAAFECRRISDREY